MEKLQKLIKQLKSTDEEQRRQAVAGLNGYPLASIKSSLFEALGDASWRVRKESVDILIAASGNNPAGIGEELVGMLRSQENAGLRNSAVESLERLGRQVTDVLCSHMDDSDHDVRKFVIDIMGNIADPAFVPALIRALEDTDANVRAAAAENLGKIRDPQALPALLRALEKDDVCLKYTILEAIARIGKPVSVASILPMASENFLKKAMYDCLGAIGDLEAVPVLLEGLKDRVKKAREAAATGVVALRRRLTPDAAESYVDASLRQLKGTPFVDGLLASLENSERPLKEALVQILAYVGDERAGKALLSHCRDERLRKVCLDAFKTMGADGARALLEAFPAADDEERCLILYLCGEFRFEDCTCLISQGMLDINPQVRKISVQAAGKTGMVAFVNGTAALLEDPEPEVRGAAVDALYRFARIDAAAITNIAGKLASSDDAEKRRNAAVLCTAVGDTDKLSLLLKDADASVRKSAVTSLARLKSAASVGSLVMALVDEDPEVRIASAAALGDVGVKEVLDPLVLALRDDDQWVQCAALKSLGRLKDDSVLPAIVELFEKGEGLVLISALDAVASIGGAKARSLVEKALDNGDEEVVKAAIAILSSGGEEWLLAHRSKLLQHPHWDVRSTFLKAMADQLRERALPYLREALSSETDDLVKGQIVELMDRAL